MNHRHPELEELADFVRGLPIERASDELEDHLEACDDCRRTADAFGAVGSAAGRTEEPPAHALRILRAFFSIESASARPRPLGLVFDNRRTGRVAGTRNLDSAQRQLHFEGPRVDLDLRLDLERNRDSLDLVGQLVERHPPRPLREAPVLLWQDGELIGRTETDRFGVFQMTVRPSGPLRLTGILGDGEAFEATFDRRRDGSERPTLPLLQSLPNDFDSTDDEE